MGFYGPGAGGPAPSIPITSYIFRYLAHRIGHLKWSLTLYGLMLSLEKVTILIR